MSRYEVVAQIAHAWSDGNGGWGNGPSLTIPDNAVALSVQHDFHNRFIVSYLVPVAEVAP